MKVLDLGCRHGHAFEGWFASEEDFRSQQSSGMLQCPVCGDLQVTKRPSAPRLHLSPGGQTAADLPVREGSVPATTTAQQADWLRAVRALLAQTEDVGAGFAHEARRIHYGEAPERSIRGEASLQETRALLDEGIAVVPLPVPAVLKEPLQ